MSSAQQNWSFNGGLKLEAHKSISTTQQISSIEAASQFVLPLQQHIGEASKLLVDPGERVLKGQMLATTSHIISASIHSPVSGTVVEICERPVPHPSGLPGMCIVIENDFAEEWIKKTPVGNDYNQMTSHDLRSLVRDAGIVGLGGAAFPAAVKQTELNIDTLIINGVECEPYISCDDMLMRERAREILMGADIIGHIIKAKECIIGIEDNKPQAIAAMQAAVDEDATGFFRVQSIPTIYPSGGEKQLVKILTGKEVPINGLPADIDVLCQNVGTAYAIYKAIFEAEPLISRIVTVTGSGVVEPKNLEVPIGTSMAHCIKYAGGYHEDADCLIMGGPMMGYTVETDELPVVKATNCLLVTNKNETHPANMSEHMPCIRCGRCVDVCPANLLPQQLYWFASSTNYERVIEYHLFDCIECGCCSYVCPSQIPLVQYYRFAKSEIWQQEYERKQSNIARERHESRLLRLERAKQAREEKLRKKREMLNKKKGKNETVEIDEKKQAIAAALERVKQKKEQQDIKPENTENLNEQQQQQIREADERRRAMQKNIAENNNGDLNNQTTNKP